MGRNISSSNIRSSKTARYLLGLGFLLLFVGIRAGLNPWFGAQFPYPIVPIAVLLAAWYCGVGPAVVTAILGYVSVEYLVRGIPFFGETLDYLVPRIVTALVLNTAIIFFVVKLRRRYDDLVQAEAKWRQTAADLSQTAADLMQSEAKLEQSERRMRASFDNAALGITEADVQGRFVAVNEQMCRMLGYSREELVGMSTADITAPEDRAVAENLSAKLRQGQLDRLDYEKQYLRRDGSRLPVHVIASAVRDETGQFLYAIGIVEDIGERKRAREAVSLLSHAIESAANSIVLTDRNGQILWANPAFTRVTGYSLEEVVDHTPRLLKSGRQPLEFYQNLWGTILKGDTWRGQLVNRRKDGSHYNEQMTITPVRAEGTDITHFVSVREDITERLETEESLRDARRSAERAKTAAEDANQAKDRFLAVLSHELRTPLTPVLAAVQAMQRKPDLSEELRLPLEIVRRNVQLEARLIDDLLDLTRIVQGKLLLERKPINICTVIERAVEIAKPDIDARKIRFEVDLKGTPHRVYGDVARLQQVIWNLLTNAVKFTPEGGCVWLRCYRDKSLAVVEVVDTGIGIEPAATSRIFNAFEQAGFTITRQFGGLGLGLAIAKRLVELHGGTISAHSEGKNQGATFRVLLPLSSDEPAAQPEQKPPRAMAGTSRRILLVEDNGDTAATMKMLLEAYDYEIETAGDVTQALKAIDAKDFDLLISDLGLPDRSGIDLMHELRRRGNTLKGIALSGYGHEEDVRRSKEAGFSLHLTKPADADLLIDAVSSILSLTAYDSRIESP